MSLSHSPRTKIAPRPGSRSVAAPRSGRPPTMVFINVRVHASTRKGLTALKARLGAASQGEVLDRLVASALK